jgi:hypothetical protein
MEEVELNGASAGGQEEVGWGGWRGMGGETSGLREYSFWEDTKRTLLLCNVVDLFMR